jgi:hypothetical protein
LYWLYSRYVISSGAPVESFRPRSSPTYASQSRSSLPPSQIVALCTVGVASSSSSSLSLSSSLASKLISSSIPTCARDSDPAGMLPGPKKYFLYRESDLHSAYYFLGPQTQTVSGGSESRGGDPHAVRSVAPRRRQDGARGRRCGPGTLPAVLMV